MAPPRKTSRRFLFNLSLGLLAPIGGSATSDRPLWTRGWSTKIYGRPFLLASVNLSLQGCRVKLALLFIVGGGPQGHESLDRKTHPLRWRRCRAVLVCLPLSLLKIP